MKKKLGETTINYLIQWGTYRKNVNAEIKMVITIFLVWDVTEFVLSSLFQGWFDFRMTLMLVTRGFQMLPRKDSAVSHAQVAEPAQPKGCSTPHHVMPSTNWEQLASVTGC